MIELAHNIFSNEGSEVCFKHETLVTHIAFSSTNNTHLDLVNSRRDSNVQCSHLIQLTLYHKKGAYGFSKPWISIS